MQEISGTTELSAIVLGFSRDSRHEEMGKQVEALKPNNVG